jgi:uncharacterized membrane protein
MISETTALEKTSERKLVRTSQSIQAHDGNGHRRNNGLTTRTAGLGWFSLALGLAELAMPSTMAGLMGVRNDARSRTTLAAFGVREMANGLALLTGKRSATWLWARVAGDLVDLSFLAAASRTRRSNRSRLLAVGGMIAGVTAVDALTAVQMTRSPAEDEGTIRVTKTVTVRRQQADVYRFFRDLKNLPRFMEHLESVTEHGRRSQWCAKAPAGMTVEWEAEISEEIPNAVLSWRSIEGASVPNRGSVTFRQAPGNRGTEVCVSLQYEPPAGKVGAAVAKLFGEEPGQQVMSDLRRFKQMMEVGEVLRSDASVHRLPHAARPPREMNDDGKQVRS